MGGEVEGTGDYETMRQWEVPAVGSVLKFGVGTMGQ